MRSSASRHHAPTSVPTAGGGASGSRLHRLAECRVALVADPVDLAQLLDRAEAAMSVAVLDDPARERRPDAVEGVELLDGGCREADRLRRGARRRYGSRGAARSWTRGRSAAPAGY